MFCVVKKSGWRKDPLPAISIYSLIRINQNIADEKIGWRKNRAPFLMAHHAFKRVVVTGIGLVTPLGTGVKQTWTRLLNSECGIVSLTDTLDHVGYEGLPAQIAAVVQK